MGPLRQDCSAAGVGSAVVMEADPAGEVNPAAEADPAAEVNPAAEAWARQGLPLRRHHCMPPP